MARPGALHGFSSHPPPSAPGLSSGDETPDRYTVLVNPAVTVDLPSTTDPEGILFYLIVLVMVAAVVLLALFAVGVWQA